MISSRVRQLLSASTLLAVAACGATPREELGASASASAVVDVDHSVVKRQSIGNCWLYATASWVESLHKSAGAADTSELNASESYWTYLHWFEQITDREVDKLQTGGGFDVAADLISRYGVVREADFVAEESEAEMSARQKSALELVNAALATGALSTPEARRDRALVRKELDRAWGLDAAVSAKLDDAFGPDLARTVGRGARLEGTGILRADEIAARLRDPSTKQSVPATLADALGTANGQGWWARREGRFAWQEASYPTTASRRRELQKRVQQALHDRQPVILSFFVDFNALDSQGRFFAPPASPGHQGGHMVVMEDYQVSSVPGFGTLAAGIVEDRPEALTAALSDDAKIDFIRVKNSWGSVRVDRQFVVPGYHDLYMKYLDGPVKQCSENADGTTDTASCWDTTPLRDVVLPAGY